MAVGSNFINATSTSIATNETFVKNFKDKKLIVVGDDLMSQFGGTAFYKGIMINPVIMVYGSWFMVHGLWFMVYGIL